MTTITREILELAALAAGCLIEPGLPPQVLARTYRDGDKVTEVYREWRPHTDIADAARLAVRLGMLVDVDEDDVHAMSQRGARVDHDRTEPDKLRAYCEAITLCAAEVGRRMREGGR